MQSFLGSISLRRQLVRTAARYLIARSQNEIVDCGNGVQLLCQHTPPQSGQKRRVAVFIHGWEGSAESTYLLSSANELWNEDYRIVRINLRDHGNSHR
jgi:hypothetical protein